MDTCIVAHNSTSFTPVRRRQSTINSRPLHSDLEQEWTAARCNRLLRALTSRVAILQKELAKCHQAHSYIISQESGAGMKLRTSRSDGQKRLLKTYTRRGGRAAKGNDRTSIKSQMCTRRATKPLLPGEVLVPTPVLNRARGQVIEERHTTQADSDDTQQRNDQIPKGRKRLRTRDEESHYQLAETMRNMRKKMPANRFGIFEGLYNGLESLLKATAPKEPEAERPSRSLFAMCLRAVPQYIQVEEAYWKAEEAATGSLSAIDNKDVSSEVYDDLEAFGTTGQGWKHLKTIVRSQGISVISNAILAGLLDVEFCCTLINLCIHSSATREAEKLLTSLLSLRGYPGPRSIFTRLNEEGLTRPLAFLWTYSDHVVHSDYQHGEIAHLITERYIPVGWLATREFGPIWSRAIQSLSLGRASASAVAFLDAMLTILTSSLSGCQQINHLSGNPVKLSLFEEIRQTFSSLLTILASITVLQQQNSLSDKFEEGSAHDQCANLLRSALIRWQSSQSLDCPGTLLVLANTVIAFKDLGYSPYTEPELLGILTSHLWTRKRAGSCEWDEVVSFVCSMARCCGRGSFTSGFDYLKDLHSRFAELAVEREFDEASLIYDIIVESASAFAQLDADPKHLDYATSVEARFLPMRSKHSSDISKTSETPARAGFRWEEGISEWVQATPYPKVNKASGQSSGGSQPPIEINTPLHPRLLRPSRPAFRLLAADVSSPGSDETSSSPESKGQVDFSPQNQTNDKNLSGLTGLHGLNHESVDESFPADDSETDESSHFGDDSSLIGFRHNSSALEDSFTSQGSSPVPLRRRCIARAPRLSRKVLQRSHDWQLFDESDDELGSHGALSPDALVLRDITNSKPRPLRRSQQLKTKYPSRKNGLAQVGDSDDELSII